MDIRIIYIFYLCSLPSFVGMYLGRKLQFKLNEEFFRKLFLFVLILVGFLIINKSVI